MPKKGSEHNSRRLFISMLIIILSLLCIAIPLIISSYKEFIKAQDALIEIKSVGAVADLANKISRERGPANNAMTSAPQDLSKNIQALTQHRLLVDQQMNITFNHLKQAGFLSIANQLKRDLVPTLRIGRQSVDQYLATNTAERQAKQLDHAILDMFDVWDSAHDVLKNVVMQSKSKDSEIAGYYIQILILADLRDQAGRVASNVIAYIAFSEPQPIDNQARSMQTQTQVPYLWDLLNTIQPAKDKTPEFIKLHQQLKSQYIDQCLPIVERLIHESNQGQAYYLNPMQLTTAFSSKFLTVMELQKYLVNYNIAAVEKYKLAERQKFVTTLFVSIICLMAALFTMIYAQRKVFKPLIQARDMIVDLSYRNEQNQQDNKEPHHPKVYSLYGAIQELRKMLRQRDEFEFQLKNIANTDKLTGVSNRLALDEYLKLKQKIPHFFENMGLIMIDIDNFKRINDQYGHILGDSVIVAITESLKENVIHSDLIVRFGGDEFLIILSGFESEQVHIYAEKIRESVFHLNLMAPESMEQLMVSVSIGVSFGAESWIALLEKADRSLLKAKEKGKNAVES